jgi:putative inorganic carbon (hco3(-)) transporter
VRGRARAFASAASPSWDALLVFTGVYLATAAGRVHSLFGPFGRLKPVILSAGLALLFYLLDQHRSRSLAALRQPMPLLALFIMVWATIGAPFALYPGMAVTQLLDELYKVGVLFLLCAAAVRNIHDVQRLALVYAAGAIAYSTVTALPAGWRAGGAGGYDANDSALFVVSALPLVLYFLVRAKSLLLRIGLAAGLLICVVAVVRSGSRGGFLAFAAVMTYTLVFSASIRPVIRLGVGAAILMAFAWVSVGQPEYWDRMSSLRDLDEDYNTLSLTGRKQTWQRGVGYMLANPLFGVGLENFPVAEARHPAIADRIAVGIGTKYTVAHSQWVEIGSELGLPGLAAFLALFLYPMIMIGRISGLVRRTRAPPGPSSEVAMLGEALIGSLIGLAVAGTFLSQAYGYPVWAMFGITAGLLKVVSFPAAGLRGRAAPVTGRERGGAAGRVGAQVIP